MNNKLLISLLLAAAPASMLAQGQKPGYVDWGIRGTEFPAAFANWEKGQKWTEDDNFFISRVKPKTRFRNEETQVYPDLTEDYDKKLIYWVPVNSPDYNALPDGKFDADIFPLWSYVTHYGNWSTSLMRMPGNFADAAHRHGVPVSVVASIPWGNLIESWKTALQKMVQIGPEKMADFMAYYGIDGIGYNSEFATNTSIPMDLAAYHAKLRHLLVDTGRNPNAEMIWYDGTNENGGITFDWGLDEHNDDIWGYGDDIKTSLFFNYNWNGVRLLNQTVNHAEKLGRTPLDLYAGINMQGGEPKQGTIWSLLARYPISIGLWGAHSESMMFESRAEKGSSPDDHMRTYMLRMERWFTGGSRNPANTPPFTNSLKYTADRTDFMGMSKMMSARSSLKWDLTEEPFITYFNLGNGKFFNFKGKRCHNQEWYNIGMQDYMPTWMWWFSSKFLSGGMTDVPENGLDAEFVWDDAWMGGSLVRVHGSTDNEYLHLFKTEFNLQNGDAFIIRYKVLSGSGDISLAISAKGSEKKVVDETKMVLLNASDNVVPGKWVAKQFMVGRDIPEMDGKDLAMIALHFRNAKDLDIRLGELSLTRGGKTGKLPATPEIESSKVLASRHGAADAKIIFNMPNDKPVGEVCYNLDVKTSLFKLYAQQEGQEPVLMGMTSSWAGMLFSIPMNPEGSSKLRLGVSALSLDMTKESDIAWDGWQDADEVYQISDEVEANKTVFKPGEAIEIAYKDARHPASTWILVDQQGNEVARSENALSLTLPDGLDEIGSYTLSIDGLIHKTDGTTAPDTRSWPAIVQVSATDKGAVPQITKFTANSQEEALDLPGVGTVDLEYASLTGNAEISRGLKLGKAGVGIHIKDTQLEGGKSFSVSFWLKPDDFKSNSGQLLSVRDKSDAWANNNWGWFWHTVKEDGSTDAFTLRMTDATVAFDLGDTYITPGVWHHLAYSFDINENDQVRPTFYLDGKKVEFKSYTRGDKTYELTGETPYFATPYKWRTKNVVAIGGYTHKLGSVRGNVDNLAFFDKGIGEEEVKASMGNFDGELPESLVGYFDFEDDCNADLTFTSKGRVQFASGSLDYNDDVVEGSGTGKWVGPYFCAGSPFVNGKAHNLEAKVEIIAPEGVVSDIEGNAESGKAKVTYLPGYYDNPSITLKVSNDYGSDIRTIPLSIGLEGIDVVESANALTTYPNPFTDRLNVTAPEAGEYRVMLMDLRGAVLTANDFKCAAGDVMTIFPEVRQGFYILTLLRDGKTVGTAKVIRK